MDEGAIALTVCALGGVIFFNSRTVVEAAEQSDKEQAISRIEHNLEPDIDDPVEREETARDIFYATQFQTKTETGRFYWQNFFEQVQADPLGDALLNANFSDLLRAQQTAIENYEVRKTFFKSNTRADIEAMFEGTGTQCCCSIL